MSYYNLLACDVWIVLDRFGRNYDTMAGNPLPLRLESIELECERSQEPEDVRWRVLEIEKIILTHRRNQAKKETR